MLRIVHDFNLHGCRRNNVRGSNVSWDDDKI